MCARRPTGKRPAKATPSQRGKDGEREKQIIKGGSALRPSPPNNPPTPPLAPTQLLKPFPHPF